MGDVLVRVSLDRRSRLLEPGDIGSDRGWVVGIRADHLHSGVRVDHEVLG